MMRRMALILNVSGQRKSTTHPHLHTHIYYSCCVILSIDMINQPKECQQIIHSLFFYILQQRNDEDSNKNNSHGRKENIVVSYSLV
mmetsp:Transcript_35249/g.40082  ORF Transcript_35249/g.40082 Transcript_35249/m.40082 type:complete len:86 (+) Transcript_35249:52-309(+)